MYRFLITYKNMNNVGNINISFYIPFSDFGYKEAWKTAIDQAVKASPGDNYVLVKIELIST